MAQKNNPEETKAPEPNKTPEANKATKERIKNFDIFIINKIYPEAEPIFTAKFKSLEAIKDTCLVVLDTNPLVIPYEVNPQSLENIEKVYKKLSSAKRIKIPGQVAREFAGLRAQKISEVVAQLETKRDGISIKTSKYPLLSSIDEYKELLTLEESIGKELKTYRDAVSVVIDKIKGWSWNDPVSTLYSQFFKNAVEDIQINQEEITKDLNELHIHSIPPGYKDQTKDDEGIGDFLIWKTILHLGATLKNDLVFVTGDNKADWWHRSNKKTLYPRYELIDQYRRISDNHTFHMVSFSKFLTLYGASTEVVEDVRSKEHLPSPPSREVYGDEIKPLPLEYFAENVIAIWLSMNFRGSVVNSSERGEFQVVHANQRLTEVIIVTVSKFSQYLEATKKINNRLNELYATNSKNAKYTLPMVVLACVSQQLAYEIMEEVSDKSRFNRDDFSIVLGFLTDRPRFVDIYRDENIFAQSLI